MSAQHFSGIHRLIHAPVQASSYCYLTAWAAEVNYAQTVGVKVTAQNLEQCTNWAPRINET